MCSGVICVLESPGQHLEPTGKLRSPGQKGPAQIPLNLKPQQMVRSCDCILDWRYDCILDWRIFCKPAGSMDPFLDCALGRARRLKPAGSMDPFLDCALGCARRLWQNYVFVLPVVMWRSSTQNSAINREASVGFVQKPLCGNAESFHEVLL